MHMSLCMSAMVCWHDLAIALQRRMCHLLGRNMPASFKVHITIHYTLKWFLFSSYFKRGIVQNSTENLHRKRGLEHYSSLHAFAL